MTQVKTIDVHELKKSYEQNPKLCLIDVREPHEWEEQHIPFALHIPKDQLAEKITTIIPDKNQPIYLHCRGGTRSLWAAERLIEQGYQHVYSVNGGMMHWAQCNYPVE